MMKRILFAALLALASTQIARASPKHWYRDWKWWAGEAVIGAAMAADAHSTAVSAGVETNPFMGPHPSNRRIALWMGSGFALQTTLHASAWHVIHHEAIKSSCKIDPPTGRYYECSEYGEDLSPWWRAASYLAVPASVAVINGHAAAHNYEVKK